MSFCSTDLSSPFYSLALEYGSYFGLSLNRVFSFLFDIISSFLFCPNILRRIFFRKSLIFFVRFSRRSSYSTGIQYNIGLTRVLLNATLSNIIMLSDRSMPSAKYSVKQILINSLVNDLCIRVYVYLCVCFRKPEPSLPIKFVQVPCTYSRAIQLLNLCG